MNALLQAVVDTLERLHCKPRKVGSEYNALCPIHEADGKSHSPSLTLREGDKQEVIVNCHAGCDGREILKVLGINGAAHKPTRTEVAVYPYVDENGTYLREKIRFNPKGFLTCHRSATGERIYKAGDGPAVLYRLPEVKAAIASGRRIYFCEGEKDVDRLFSLGRVATTNIEGAMLPGQKTKWKPDYAEQLRGAVQVVLLPDNDPQGRAHVQSIAIALRGVVPDVRIVDLAEHWPEIPEKGGDVSNWLDAGHTVEELDRLADEAPTWRSPPAQEPTTPELPPIAAYETDFSPPAASNGVEMRPEKEAERYKVPPLDHLRLSESEARSAKLHPPRCIVKDYLYTDVGVLIAPGGTGKTTLILWEYVHIILGMLLYGLRVVSPGPCLLITAEDSREVCMARLREVMAAMGLTDEQRRTVYENLYVWDVSSEGLQLIELDGRGNIVFTPMVAEVCAAFKDAGLAAISIDPTVSFGAGERLINDNEQWLIKAGRRIKAGTGACVRFVMHTGKANAREKALDQYAGRNGSAMPDGCRMVAVLQSVGGEETDKLTPPAGFSLSGTHESGVVLARPKLSYARPNLPYIWIKRTGFLFEHTTEIKVSKDEQRRAYAEQVHAFLTDQMKQTPPRHHTQRTLEAENLMHRSKLRTALADLDTDHRVIDAELPKNKRRGKRKTYLQPLDACPSNAPADDGALVADNPPFPPSPGTNAPPFSIAPPYREKSIGAIRRADVFTPSSHCAGAHWRISGALAQ